MACRTSMTAAERAAMTETTWVKFHKLMRCNTWLFLATLILGMVIAASYHSTEAPETVTYTATVSLSDFDGSANGGAVGASGDASQAAVDGTPILVIDTANAPPSEGQTGSSCRFSEHKHKASLAPLFATGLLLLGLIAAKGKNRKLLKIWVAIKVVLMLIAVAAIVGGLLFSVARMYRKSSHSRDAAPAPVDDTSADASELPIPVRHFRGGDDDDKDADETTDEASTGRHHRGRHHGHHGERSHFANASKKTAALGFLLFVTSVAHIAVDVMALITGCKLLCLTSNCCQRRAAANTAAATAATTTDGCCKDSTACCNATKDSSCKDSTACCKNTKDSANCCCKSDSTRGDKLAQFSNAKAAKPSPELFV